MSTPEERLRQKAEQLAREIEVQELLKQQEVARRRATQTERALRATALGRKFHHWTLRMRDAPHWRPSSEGRTNRLPSGAASYPMCVRSRGLVC